MVRISLLSLSLCLFADEHCEWLRLAGLNVAKAPKISEDISRFVEDSFSKYTLADEFPDVQVILLKKMLEDSIAGEQYEWRGKKPLELLADFEPKYSKKDLIAILTARQMNKKFEAIDYLTSRGLAATLLNDRNLLNCCNKNCWTCYFR
jgi:hypothetical protein